MKKILKNVQPSIRAYLGLACCYSIIDEQAFNSGWVYDKYIHLEYTPYDSQIKYADYEHYDFLKCFNSVHLRHCNIHKYEVWL